MNSQWEKGVAYGVMCCLAFKFITVTLETKYKSFSILFLVFLSAVTFCEANVELKGFTFSVNKIKRLFACLLCSVTKLSHIQSLRMQTKDGPKAPAKETVRGGRAAETSALSIQCCDWPTWRQCRQVGQSQH